MALTVGVVVLVGVGDVEGLLVILEVASEVFASASDVLAGFLSSPSVMVGSCLGSGRLEDSGVSS